MSIALCLISLCSLILHEHGHGYLIFGQLCNNHMFSTELNMCQGFQWFWKVLFVCICLLFCLCCVMIAGMTFLQDWKNKTVFASSATDLRILKTQIILLFLKLSVKAKMFKSKDRKTHHKTNTSLSFSEVCFIAEAFAGEVETFSVLFRTYVVTSAKWDSLLNILN